jgi:serine/threonine protein kinase
VSMGVVPSNVCLQRLYIDICVSRAYFDAYMCFFFFFCNIVNSHLYVSTYMFNNIKSRPVDVWAMGILLYILMSGETLWEDNTPKEVIEAVKKHEWSFDQSEAWADQPRAAKDLIE